MTTGAPAVLRGEARHPGGTSAAATVTLGEDAFTVAVAGTAPWSAGYRDLGAVAVDGGIVMIQLGDGAGAERWLFERFGTMTGLLARGLRDGRLRQRLADGLVETDPDAEIDLVEYEAGAESGIAQLLYHDRGVVLAPVDDRLPWRRIRRADIGAVDLRAGGGRGGGRERGPLAWRRWPVAARRCGSCAWDPRPRSTGTGGRPSATAPPRTRRRSSPGWSRTRPSACGAWRRPLMLEGRPVTPEALGEAWVALETAALGHPPFDESYRRAAGDRRRRRRPRDGWPRPPSGPAAPTSRRLWFFVGLPGNLVAMELVSAGSHATYLFRVVPRATFEGTLPAGALDAAVADVSEALIDARFLREPMALPAARLAEPAGAPVPPGARGAADAGRCPGAVRGAGRPPRSRELAGGDRGPGRRGTGPPATTRPSGRAGPPRRPRSTTQPAVPEASEDAMPTFKHPCPHCGTFINRDVVACPACGRQDPFTPGRCGNCRAPLEDASWVACPKCGQPVGAAAVAAAAAQAQAAQARRPPHRAAIRPGPTAGAGAIPGWGQATAPVPAPVHRPPPVAPARGRAGTAGRPAPRRARTAGRAARGGTTAACSACGSPLPPGARFCRDCGTPR